LGGVGLASVLGAAASGARQVIAIDLADDKLELAQRLGATHSFNAGRPDVIEAIREASFGGVETAIEMAGSTRAFEIAYRVTRRGGATVTAGLPPPDATWAMPVVNMVAEERTIKGSYVGTCVPLRDIPRYVDLFRGGRLPVDRLLTGTLALDDINQGFDLLHEGKAVRQVVVL
jgi:alcohol dehydrogenase